jgi:hypothetical protein
MGSMLRKRTGFVVVFAVMLAGLFAPSALANSPLTISKTATAHWTRSFDWTIEKSVSPSSHTLQTGQSGTSTYTVTVTKNESTSSMWVDGQICLQNTGPVATENLTIVDRLRAYRPGGSQTLISSNIDVSANPVLDPGESYCYAYSFPFGPFPDATAYENDARATITNDPREPGAALGPSATAPFTVPNAPVATNDSVNVDDTNGMSWLFSASGSKTYSRTFTCDRDKGAHSNTATIRETGQSDSATVTVTCKDKPGDCPPHHKKGKKGHGYGHDYGEGGYNNYSSGYSQRGRDDDCNGNPGDDHDDDSDDSSDDSDDSDDGDCKGDRRGWGD